MKDLLICSAKGQDKMPLKEKFLGAVLIIVGALPLLFKIEKIAEVFSKYKFLSYITPGKITYQIIIILIGLLLIWRIKLRTEINN